MGDRLPVGIPSRCVNQPTGLTHLASLRGRYIEYELCWGKGGNVTSAWWQIALGDLIWHVSSCSGVVTWQTVTLLYLFTSVVIDWILLGHIASIGCGLLLQTFCGLCVSPSVGH